LLPALSFDVGNSAVGANNASHNCCRGIGGLKKYLPAVSGC
jgi:hypothetical protein